MTPTSGLVKFTGKHLDRFTGALQRVMETRDIESVHQLRVASRRLAEPLELLSSMGERKTCTKLRRSFGDVRRALRQVRDIDVLHLAIGDRENDLFGNAEEIARLQGALVIEREAALCAAREQIAAARPGRMRAKLKRLLREMAERESGDQDEHVLSSGKALWRKKAERLLDRPPAHGIGPGLHKTRIRLKALRYATELMTRLDGVDREALLAQMSAMQDHLGSWNDHFSAVRLLAEIACDAETLAGCPAWSGRILGYAAHRSGLMNVELERILVRWPRLREAIESGVMGRLQSHGASSSRTALTAS